MLDALVPKNGSSTASGAAANQCVDERLAPIAARILIKILTAIGTNLLSSLLWVAAELLAVLLPFFGTRASSTTAPLVALAFL